MPRPWRSQQLWPPVQLSGEIVQPATTQTCACSVSQWLASKPVQSASLVHAVPKPVGPLLHAARVSSLAHGTHAPFSAGASMSQMHASEDGSNVWCGPHRSPAEKRQPMQLDAKPSRRAAPSALHRSVGLVIFLSLPR